MTTLLLSMLVVGLLIAGMAVGVLMGREPIKGSCGGMSAIGMDTGCDICGGDQSKCDKSPDAAAGGKREGVDFFQP